MKNLMPLLFVSFLFIFSSCGEKAKQGVVKETVVDNGRSVEVEVITTGYGTTRADAVYDAINEAVKKVLGQKVDIKTSLFSEKASANVEYSGRVNVARQGKADINADVKTTGKLNVSSDDFKRAIMENTKGIISTYDILDEKEQKDKWSVRLKTTVIKHNADKEAARIRIAVAPFGINNSNYKGFSSLILKQITEELIKTQKFAIPDREYTKEQNLEKALINDKEMSISELSKLGSKLAVDYIVTGTLEKLSSSKSETKSKITGHVLSTSHHQSVKVSFRLIDIATGLVKLTDVYEYASDTEQSMEALTNKVSDYITDYIVTNLVPVFVEKASGSTLYIAIGGDRLKVGQQIKIVQYLGEIKDSSTGELLGYEEKEVGKAEVTDVQTKLTTAKIIESTIDINKEFKPKMFIVKTIIAKAEPAKTKAAKTKNKAKDMEKDSDW